MIPRFGLYRHASCDPLSDDDDPVEGRTLVISWLGLVIEIGVWRRVA